MRMRWEQLVPSAAQRTDHGKVCPDKMVDLYMKETRCR
jgi:hypothetical protein